LFNPRIRFRILRQSVSFHEAGIDVEEDDGDKEELKIFM